MQLAAYGAQDVYLTGNPQITFFKVAYRRHTNFSMEHIRQAFKGDVGAGKRVVATLARNGDLVHDCFLKMNIADIQATGNNPGHNVLDYIECEIGGQKIDKHYGHWMEAHAELTELPGQGVSVNSLTRNNAGAFGYDDSGWGSVGGGVPPVQSAFQLLAAAGGVLAEDPEDYDEEDDGEVVAPAPKRPVIAMVPLRFWFCRHVGLSLPLIALQYHEVNIIVQFANGEGAKKLISTGNNISLWCNYIYLDTDERRRFAQVSHEYLIEQVQTQSLPPGSGPQTFDLKFNHPVKELIWGVLGVSDTGESAWGGTGVDDYAGGFVLMYSNDDPPTTIQLKLNGHDRFEKIEPEYFTRYQIKKYHTGMPMTTNRDCLSVYSFALEPEEHQPSGTCNFSRIDNAQLLIQGAGITDEVMSAGFIYAINYNVLRIMSGMGGLAYSN